MEGKSPAEGHLNFGVQHFIKKSSIFSLVSFFNERSLSLEELRSNQEVWEGVSSVLLQISIKVTLVRFGEVLLSG